MEYATQLTTLTQAFYNAYPQAQYPEIPTKQSRPYKCMLLETHDGYFICLPFRTNIRHRYAFTFGNNRSRKKANPGIDISKMIIITEPSYISDSFAIVKKSEYNETMAHLDTIVNRADQYLQSYINHVLGNIVLSEPEFSRKYGHSCLPYFHKELGLDK